MPTLPWAAMARMRSRPGTDSTSVGTAHSKLATPTKSTPTTESSGSIGSIPSPLPLPSPPLVGPEGPIGGPAGPAEPGSAGPLGLTDELAVDAGTLAGGSEAIEVGVAPGAALGTALDTGAVGTGAGVPELRAAIARLVQERKRG